MVSGFCFYQTHVYFMKFFLYFEGQLLGQMIHYDGILVLLMKSTCYLVDFMI